MRNPRPLQNRTKKYALPRNYTALGKFLQEMRLQNSLTQREVAEELEYSSAQFISNFERGMGVPPAARLRKMVKLYRMPTDRLMELILEGHREELEQELSLRTERTRKA